MAVLEVASLPGFWRATLLDLTIMVVLILPPLYALVYRPFIRLLEAHSRFEEALERRTRELEALVKENETLL